jgi:hypothetical protein
VVVKIKHGAYVALCRVASVVSGQSCNRLLQAAWVAIQDDLVPCGRHVIHPDAVPRMIAPTAWEHLIIMSTEVLRRFADTT